MRHQYINQLSRYFQSKTQNLRAKVWNIEKENRAMIKQIENWGMMHQVDLPKPFVDTITTQKVFKDNCYLSVTLKKEVLKQQSILKEKEKILQEINNKIQDYQEQLKLYNDMENDAYKEYKVCLQLAKNRKVRQKQELLELKKKRKYEINQLQASINVVSFNNDVQQRNEQQIAKEIEEFRNRIRIVDQQIQKMEYQRRRVHIPPRKTIRKRFSQIQNFTKDNLDQDDEILEQRKKIERLNFQIQEMTRNCILEKQDYIREIDENKQELSVLKQRIFEYKMLNLKGSIQNQKITDIEVNITIEQEQQEQQEQQQQNKIQENDQQ